MPSLLHSFSIPFHFVSFLLIIILLSRQNEKAGVSSFENTNGKRNVKRPSISPKWPSTIELALVQHTDDCFSTEGKWQICNLVIYRVPLKCQNTPQSFAFYLAYKATGFFMASLASFLWVLPALVISLLLHSYSSPIPIHSHRNTCKGNLEAGVHI